MNTNSNTYTVVYTSIVVVAVAAILAAVSQYLGTMQQANEKAETISQILSAAGFGEKDSWAEKGNAATIEFYKENIARVVVITSEGAVTDSLDCSKAEIYSVSDLKAQNYEVAEYLKTSDVEGTALPVYEFKNGVSVFPIYGAGLWGPVWGYIAFNKDLTAIVGAYFDHESETPGLGGKIKDDPSFRESFEGKSVIFGAEGEPFNIVKGGAPKDMRNGVDAITGATMTSKGVAVAVNNWLKAYRRYIEAAASAE